MAPLELDELTRMPWDAVVIGAGPAGGVAAAVLAQRGMRVLLVEKSSTWPRFKVCGGCINAGGMNVLREIGLAAVLAGAMPLRKVTWHVGHRRLTVPLIGGMALRREELDARLVQAAVGRGCEFLSGVTATVEGQNDLWATVRLRRGSQTIRVPARSVLACDGIGGSALAEMPWARWHVRPRSWIGIGGDWPVRRPVEPGEIGMQLGEGGYVGAARLADRSVISAAAVSLRACREVGGPAELIRRVLGQPRDVEPIALHGTPALTRHRACVGRDRVLAVGDACGYGEPYSGEGIAQAIVAGHAAAGIAGDDHSGEQWQAWHHRWLAGRIRRCAMMRHLVHHRAIAEVMASLGNRSPRIAERWVRAVSMPSV